MLWHLYLCSPNCHKQKISGGGACLCRSAAEIKAGTPGQQPRIAMMSQSCFSAKRCSILPERVTSHLFNRHKYSEAV